VPAIDECIFHHELVLTNNDVYYSWKYPRRRTKHVIRKTPSSSLTHEHQAVLARHNISRRTSADLHNGLDTGRLANIGRSDPDKCMVRWFIGAKRDGKLRAYKTNPCHVLQSRTLFIQRWLHRSSPSSGVQQDVYGRYSMHRPPPPPIWTNQSSTAASSVATSSGGKHRPGR